MTVPTSGPPVRVLLVEDTLGDAWLFQRAADRSGEAHELRIEASAEMALDLLRSGAWRPDVLVVDERLPGMPGSWLVAQVTADATFGHLLIFRYTAFGDALAPDMIGKGILRKPPTPDEAAVVLRLGQAARDILRLPRLALRDVLAAWDAGGALAAAHR